MSFGPRLKNLRFEKGYSVKEVARRLGIAESTYRDWEYGMKIKGEPYVKLAELYEVSLTWLLTGKRDPIEEELKEMHQLLQKIRAKL